MSDDLVKRLRHHRTTNSATASILLMCKEAADRIEALESLLRRLDGPFRASAPLFGAQHLRSVRIGEDLIEDICAVLAGEKNDD